MRTPEFKRYSIAIRELWSVPHGAIPPNWPENPKDWTIAQTLAERDLMRAVAGDPDCAERVISRAEGRVPQAPEDAAIQAETNRIDRIGDLAALGKLQALLSNKAVPEDPPITDGEVVDDKSD